MRKKIAMRIRRDLLRKGVIISNEKPVFSKQELRENGLSKKDRGFGFVAEYRGWKWVICADDRLAAYRLFIEVMNDELG